MVTLLTGLVGFGLGLFFGWVLHRERVTRGGSAAVPQSGDQATTALADASAQLELADQDLVSLQAQLSDAQQLLDERAAIIAELQAQLAEFRGETVEDDVDEGAEHEPADREASDVVGDGSAKAVTRSEVAATLDDEHVDEMDVTDELVTPIAAGGEEAATPPGVEEAATPPGVEEAATPAGVEEEAEPEEAVDEPEPAEVAERVEAVDEAEPVEGVAPEDVVVDAEPDDLRRIRGIGPAMERLLNEQGIVNFRQLATLDDAGIKELEAKLPGVPGRVSRDRWVEQARDLHLETHGDQP